MSVDAHQRFYVLSFDHRGSFKTGLMGIAGASLQGGARAYLGAQGACAGV